MSRVGSAAAALLGLSTVLLAGCAGSPVQPEQPVEVRLSDSSIMTKTQVEGTELLCIVRGSYGSASCNWELWNKQHEAKK